MGKRGRGRTEYGWEVGGERKLKGYKHVEETISTMSFVAFKCNADEEMRGGIMKHIR